VKKGSADVVARSQGIEGNRLANQLIRPCSEYPFIEPEPEAFQSCQVGCWAVRDWMNTHFESTKHREFIAGHSHMKVLLQGPSAKNTREPVGLNTNHLGTVIGLCAGHC
jgi:hypothetical protein